jgi:hypothetical protein
VRGSAVVFTGWGQSLDAAVAADQARRAAVRAAVEASCGDLDPAAWLLVERLLEDVADPGYDELSGRACAHVALSDKSASDHDGSVAAVRAAIAGLLDEVLAERRGLPVDVAPPRWSPDGCGAGRLGDALAETLRRAVAARGVRLRAPGDVVTPAAQLELELAHGRKEILVTPRLGLPAREVALSLTPLALPDALLGDDPVPACWTDDALGLTAGQARGPGGHQVAVEVGPGRSTACDGGQLAIRVAVDRASRVRVFWVHPDGSTGVVWPPEGASDTVERVLEISPVAVSAVGGAAGRRVVAVAVRAGASLGQLEGWVGGGAGSLGAVALPADSARAAAGMSVLEQGVDRCPVFPGAVSAASTPDLCPR